MLKYLEERDDNDEESVSRQQDPGLLDGAAVAQEADYEDECSGSDQDVGPLLNHWRLGQLLKITNRCLSKITFLVLFFFIMIFKKISTA